MALIHELAVRVYGAVARVIPFDREPFRTLYSRAYFAYKRIAEDPFARLAARRPELFRGGDVVDAGANIGYTALLFARFIDADRLVHAFEPDAATYSLLTRNVARSPFGARVRTYPEALGGRSGRVSFWHNRAHPADHRVVSDAAAADVTKVDVRTVDELVGDGSVAFVKIDVQGYELEVSRGMERVLARNADVAVAVEVAPELGPDSGEMLRFYLERGFRLHLIAHDGSLVVADADRVLREAARVGYVNVLCTRRAL